MPISNVKPLMLVKRGGGSAMSWFLVRTKSRQEKKAQVNLESQGFINYFPELARDNGRKEALFPGYIFVKNEAGPTPFDKIRNTYGVQGYVRFGNKLTLVDDLLIDSLKDRDESLVQKDIYEPAQRVRITEGPFKNIEAIYLCRSAKDRVILLFNLMNSKQRIEVCDNIVRSA